MESRTRLFARGGDVAPVIEDAMRAAGFDDTMFNPFTGGWIGYPWSSRYSFGSETDLTYRHSRRIAVGIRRTSVDLGSTHGQQADIFKSLSLNSRVTAFAPVAYLRVNRHLRVGAGPLAASTEVYYRPDSEPSRVQSFKSTVYGGLVTASLEGSIARYIAIGFNVSRVWIPVVAVGPFTSDFGDALNEKYGTASLPAMRVNPGHYTIGLSLGIRF